MDNIARPQNYHQTADPMHYGSYELQPSSSYGNPVHNPQSWHSAQYDHTTHWQRGVYPGTPVTGGNPPPSYIPPMRYPHGYTPYQPQYVSPSTNASSSSYREPSSYRREPSAHYPEAYHGPWQQRKDPTICDPQAAGYNFPEPPVPSMEPSTSAAVFSHSRIDHGDGLSNPSYRSPSTQPHQDPPCIHGNSRSRQNSCRRHGSHTYETYHSPSTVFSCGWLVGENTTCGFEGPLDEFKRHFGRIHLRGAQDAPNECRWQYCTYRKRTDADIHVMRRDSVWRHVQETHLGMKRTG
jgi:hypothetical protein